jgi:predicted 3-demethylubiquinone-9 3-methyltransferase (glyoxalase superfamily)
VQKITPFLWFDDKAEEAARFYTSIFCNSVIIETIYYGRKCTDRYAALAGRL